MFSTPLRVDTLSTWLFAIEGSEARIRIVGEDIEPQEVEELIRLAVARGCKRISIVVVGKVFRVLDRLRPVIKGSTIPTIGLWIASSLEEAEELEEEGLGELFA